MAFTGSLSGALVRERPDGPRGGVVQGRRGLAREHHARPQGRLLHRPVVPRPAAVAAARRRERRPARGLLEDRGAAVAVRLERAQLRGGRRRSAACPVSPRPSAAGATARRQVLPGVPASIAALVGDPNNTSACRCRGTSPASTIARSRRSPARSTGGPRSARVTSVTSFDTLDLVGTLETFPYFPSCSRRRTRRPARATTRSCCRRPCSARSQRSTRRPGRTGSTMPGARRCASRLQTISALRWILGGYFVATDLDVMISVNRDLGGGDVVQETDPNIGGVNPDGALERAVRRGGGSGVTSRANPGAIPPSCLSGPLPAHGLRREPRQPESEPGRAVVQLRPQRQQRVCGFRTGERRRQRAGRGVVRAPLRPRRSPADHHGTAGVPARVPVPERPGRRRARGVVRRLAAEGDRPLEADRGDHRVRRLCAGLPQRRLQPERRGRRRGGPPFRGCARHARGRAGFWDQEDTRGVELGFKSSVPAARRRFSASGFYTRIDDAFTFFFVAPFNAQIIRNIDEARSAGFEADVSWLPRHRAAARFRGRAARHQDPEERLAGHRRRRHPRQEAAVQPGFDRQRRHRLLAPGAPRDGRASRASTTSASGARRSIPRTSRSAIRSI